MRPPGPRRGATPTRTSGSHSWSEAHGLSDEKLGHLAQAVLNDPKDAAARGLLGLVAFRGQWQRPDAVADRALRPRAGRVQRAPGLGSTRAGTL